MPANPKPQKMLPNLELRDHIYRPGCLIKGCLDKPWCHHVKTRGAGGIDEFNMIPLCLDHHTEIHQIGREAFEKKYGLPCIKSLAILFTVSFYGAERAKEELALIRGIDIDSAEAIILNAIDNVNNGRRDVHK